MMTMTEEEQEELMEFKSRKQQAKLEALQQGTGWE